MVGKKLFAGFVITAALLLCGPAWAQAPQQPDVAVRGLLLRTDNLDQADLFYSQVLGFRLEESSQEERVLINGPARIVLRQSRRVKRSPRDSRVSLNFRVADLDTTVGAAIESGGSVEGNAAEENQIGWHRTVGDPSGNRLNLMEITQAPLDAGSPPVVFNMSIRVDHMEEAESFYTGLGFQVFSRQYLPATLPFQRLGGISIVIHPAEHDKLGTPADPVLLLETDSMDVRLEALRQTKGKIETQDNGYLVVAPSGNKVLLTGVDME